MSSKSTWLGPKGRKFSSFNKDFISWTFGGIWNPLAGGGQNSMKMAWNISIHTKESMTFDSLLILLSTSFGRMYHTYHVIRVVDQTPRKGKYGSATAMELCYLHSTFIHVHPLLSISIPALICFRSANSGFEGDEKMDRNLWSQVCYRSAVLEVHQLYCSHQQKWSSFIECCNSFQFGFCATVLCIRH